MILSLLQFAENKVGGSVNQTVKKSMGLIDVQMITQKIYKKLKIDCLNKVEKYIIFFCIPSIIISSKFDPVCLRTKLKE